MLLRDVCSVAFYCQCCGKIHVHDIPYFSGKQRIVLRCGSCAHEQAVLLRCNRHRLEFSVGCVVCHTENTVMYSLKQLRHLQLEKIYCSGDHFELGYIGRRRCIEEFLDFNQAEFEALNPADGQYYMLREK